MSVATAHLVSIVSDARARSLALIGDLDDAQLLGTPLDIVNPLIWEIGHIAWFQEKWVLRNLFGEPSIRADADLLYDSATVPHDIRWNLGLPSRDDTFSYATKVRDRLIERLETGPIFERSGQGPMSRVLDYFVQLSVYHEDMHTEAFTYTRQTLGFAAPQFQDGTSLIRSPDLVAGELLSEYVEIPGCRYWLGSTPLEPFIFDNEKWLHQVPVETFQIARSAVTQSEFAEFVEARGYQRREFWSEQGWTWRESVGANHPVYWQREPNGPWLRRHFDRWLPLEPNRPVIHVNWFEAEAYCRWAHCRLPTEAEWEYAATGHCDSVASIENGSTSIWSAKPPYPWGDQAISQEHANLDWTAMDTIDVGARPDGDSPFGCRQMLGNVWEWTGSEFGPYPGFCVDPYREYSVPWFGGGYKVLRGGAYTTRSRFIRSCYRNFYMPDRRDVLAGFRTCKLHS